MPSGSSPLLPLFSSGAISFFTIIGFTPTPIFSVWQGFTLRVLSSDSTSAPIYCVPIWAMIRCPVVWPMAFLLWQFFWIAPLVPSPFTAPLPFSRLAHPAMPFFDDFHPISVCSFGSFPNTVPPSFSSTPKVAIVTISPFSLWVPVQFRVPFRLQFQFGSAWLRLPLFPPWSSSKVFPSVSFVRVHFLFPCT